MLLDETKMLDMENLVSPEGRGTLRRQVRNLSSVMVRIKQDREGFICDTETGRL